MKPNREHLLRTERKLRIRTSRLSSGLSGQEATTPRDGAYCATNR